ncbi:Ig-like domain-containing protein (plasmid) [Vibrio sp. SS-MA-C1-2]|uniref:Ig-like domain-containing protein n=1 Tax=Vibrio sp. SS-MA-C1-2 TaxID=2908646 RepID=UPI001F365500|nr:Ig-like domain-containing protein [Vibrio sp. SS-MA-C1-2]UJF20349.1 Ig-like domain-containing protein [Vibrio sp. SS-MA-C1-2]
MIRRLIMSIAFLFTLSTTTVQATVVEVGYDGKTYYPEVDVTPYFNNASDITIVTKVGLDRFVEVEVRRGGALTYQHTTELIGVDDDFTVLGELFYGESLVLNNVNVDGQYTVTLKTIDINGNEVANHQFNFIRDTIAPTLGNLYKTGYSMVADVNGHWFHGQSGLSHIPNRTLANDIVDNNGVVEVFAKSYRYNGSQYIEYATAKLSYDAESKIAELPHDGSRTTEQDQIFPKGTHGTELLAVKFVAIDVAGNEGESNLQTLYFDSKTVTAEPYAVYNPNATGTLDGLFDKYERYESSKTIYQNPFTIIYRIPKSEYITEITGGTGFVGNYDVQIHGDYAYGFYRLTHGNYNGNYWRTTSRLRWSDGGIGPNLVLDSSVGASPVRSASTEYYYSDVGWRSFNRWHIQTSQLPITITHVRQQVQPRPYEQKFTHRGHNCIIPANGTSCTIDIPDIALNSGTSGYLHDVGYLNASDNRFSNSSNWADVSWNDEHAPSLTSWSFDDETRILTFALLQPGGGAWFDNLRLRSVFIADENQTNLNAKLISGNRIGKTIYEYQFLLDDIPAGQHQIFIRAEEMHGLVLHQKVLDFYNDQTSPSLVTKYDNAEQYPDVVSDLRQVTLEVTDNSEITPYIRLHGLGVDVQLGFSLISKTGNTSIFAAELPKVFPNLDETERYTLELGAIDAFGNEGEISKSIRYLPSNIFITEAQPYFTADRPIYLSAGDYLARIYSDGHLVTANGQVATGEQYAEIQLKPDASFAIYFRVNQSSQPIRVEPGELKGFNFTLSSTGGAISFEIWPAEGKLGQSDYLLFIPQLVSKP